MFPAREEADLSHKTGKIASVKGIKDHRCESAIHNCGKWILKFVMDYLTQKEQGAA
jgi:hypothetical protein